MRVLTVRQPWAWAIMHGGKDVENRSRNIAGSYRGPVAIHAAQADAANAPDALWLAAAVDHQTTVLREPGKSHARWQPRGVIIGVVDLVEVHEWIDDSQCSGFEGADGEATCSTWGMANHHHLVLANPRSFAPIPAKGRLGLWKPSDDLAERIASATTDPNGARP